MFVVGDGLADDGLLLLGPLQPAATGEDRNNLQSVGRRAEQPHNEQHAKMTALSHHPASRHERPGKNHCSHGRGMVL